MLKTIRIKDILSFSFFLIFWIVPLLYVNLSKQEIAFFPRTLTYFQRVGLLFTDGIERWPNYYIQALPENSQDWITLPENDYFRLQPFGYRTRLNQMLLPFVQYAYGYQHWHTTRMERNEEVAVWIKNRYEKLYPYQPRLKAVRIVLAWYDMNESTPVYGHWRQPPLESFPKDKVSVLSTHNF